MDFGLYSILTNQIHYFKEWLVYLKREVKQPDLWEEVQKYKLPPDINAIKLDENNQVTASGSRTVSDKKLFKLDTYLSLLKLTNKKEYRRFTELLKSRS